MRVPLLFALALLPARAGAEHQTIPDFAAAPTLTSAQPGPWTDPATWNPARVPADGDVVKIVHAVTVAGNRTERPDVVQVAAGGTLTIQDNTTLRAGTIQVRAGGTLTAGTPDAPARGSIVFIPTTLDTPDQYKGGLLAEGTVRITAEPRGQRFIRLAALPAAGATFLPLEAYPAGWKVGDRVLIPDSKMDRWRAGTEVNQSGLITAINSRGITIDTPLALAPYGPAERDGSVKYRPHVVNLTCSFDLSSEQSATQRAHTLATNEADWRTYDVGFRDLGRTVAGALNDATNHIGRYAVHFHHLNGPASTLDKRQFALSGCVVERSTKWPVAIHNSHYGDVTGNVVWETSGPDGIATEQGNETDVRIARNFVGAIRKGSAIWHHSVRCPTNDNVFAGIFDVPGDSEHGMGGVYYDGLNARATGEPSIPTDQQTVPKFPGASDPADFAPLPAVEPIWECRGNEGYGIGGAVVYLDHRKAEGFPYLGTARHLVRDTVEWQGYMPAVNHYDTRGTEADGVTARDSHNGFGMGGGATDWRTLYRHLDIYLPGGTAFVNLQNATSDVTIEDSRLTGNPPVVMKFPQTRNLQESPDTDPPRAKSLLLRRCVLEKTGGAGPLWQTGFANGPNGSSAPCCPWTFRIESHQNAAGHDFDVFDPAQVPDAPCPFEGDLPGDTGGKYGCPAQGLTNQQSWQKYRRCVGGKMSSGVQ